MGGFQRDVNGCPVLRCARYGSVSQMIVIQVCGCVIYIYIYGSYINICVTSFVETCCLVASKMALQNLVPMTIHCDTVSVF